jgi:Na+-driven multidrug efflux pump
MTFAVRGGYQLFHAVIVHEGKTKIFMYISLGSGALNLILNYFLIHLNGIVGAMQATFIAFIVVFLWTFYFANKYSKLCFVCHDANSIRKGKWQS